MKKITYIEELEDFNFEINEKEEHLFIFFPKKGISEKKTINFNVKGKKASIEIIGIIIGKDTDTFPLKINANILESECKCRINIKSILFNKSKIDLKANIYANKQSKKSNAKLSHKTLMLSKLAKTHTLPSLEIKCADIKASHSATIGKINDSELFYLQSRGINKKDAKIILIKGFIGTQTAKIKDKNIRSNIEAEIDKLLPCTTNNCYCPNKNCPC